MSRSSLVSPLLLGLAALLTPPRAAGEDAPKPLRAGIIGLDTSHVVAFTKVLNDPDAKGDLAGIRVVAAYPGGSPDIAASRDRVEGFTRQLRDEFKVEIVDSIDALLEKVDVVLLESVDGRPHLEQVEPVLKARKPVFIDKPVAGSLADAIAIFELAEKYGTPCFSSSSLRFSPAIQALRGRPEGRRGRRLRRLRPVLAGGAPPRPLLVRRPRRRDALHRHGHRLRLGDPGAARRGRTSSTGTWKDGRVGTFRGIRQGKADYGALAFGTKGIVPRAGLRRLRAAAGGDLQVLPDGPAAGRGRGDARDVRLHGGGRREQTTRRCPDRDRRRAWPRHGPRPASKPTIHREIEVRGSGLLSVARGGESR